MKRALGLGRLGSCAWAWILMAPVAAVAEPLAAPRTAGEPVGMASPLPTRALLAQLDGNPLLLMLPDSLNSVRGRQRLEANREVLERDPESPVAGNPEGDVTVVEFFDYRCPYCRRFAERLRAMLEADPGVRFVFREWPMFGGVSVIAARAARAADRQSQYLAMHEALMATRLLIEKAILMRAGELGLDLQRLRTDLASSEVDW